MIKPFYETYINSKVIYRVVSEEYLSQIKKEGFNHEKDPFKLMKKDIYKLFNILLKLKKKGFIIMRWWGQPVDQEGVINCTKKDLENKYIDFTPDLKNVNYYLKLKGGALVQTVLIFTEELLIKKPSLDEKDYTLINKLNQWAKKKSKFKNRVISIKGSSKYLETAKFQTFTGKYVDSPFGSFEHFKKVIKKQGLEFYKPYLTGKKLFYLRTIKPIPVSELKIK
jgi:hypothetical protein